MKPTEIRPARESDVRQIVDLCALHAAYEKAEFQSANKAELLAKHLFHSPFDIKCLVVDINDELVGYAVFMKQFSTWDAHFYIYLDCLYLKEETRGKGMGELIMQRMRDYAQSENCGIMQWQTPDFNEKAINFYRKLGAKSKTKERFSWEV